MIEYGYNSIVIRNVDKNSENFKKFHSTFSSWNKVTFSYDFSIYTEYNGDIYIPRGVGVNYVKSFFPNKQVVFNPSTTIISRNIKYKMVNQPRDELQLNAIKFLTNMTFDNIRRDRLLVLNTGDGKTYVTIHAISNIQKAAMIIVDSQLLAEQWKEEFLKHTDLTENDIMILSGRKSVEQAMVEKEKRKIYIAIHRTLYFIIQENPADLPALFSNLGIGVRVFDECHLEFGNICSINSFSNVEYSIYLTATPHRSKFTDNHLYKKVFGSMLMFNGKKVKADRYHVVYAVRMNSKPDIKQQSRMKTNYGFSIPRWATYLLEERYELVWDVIISLINRLKILDEDRPMQTAIVFPSLALINKVHKDLENELMIDIGVLTSDTPKNKRDEETMKPIFLTTEKMFGEGIDTDIECMIVFSSLSSNANIEQLIGRIRYGENKRHIYVDVRDIGFSSLVNHYKKRKSFYKKYAKMIIESEEIFEW